MTTSSATPARVSDIQPFSPSGPWKTKSGGELLVLGAWPWKFLQEKFFSYSSDELAKIPGDIRGLRSYVVHGLPDLQIGGTEFHKIRHELLLGLAGMTHWTFEDAFGEEYTLELELFHGVYIPPNIMHTYRTMRDQSAILVICNPLFDPDNPSTHDTYPREEFERLKQSLKNGG